MLALPWPWIRFALMAALVLLASTILLKYDNLLLWKITLGVTELSLRLLVPSILLALWSLLSTPHQTRHFTTIGSLLAAVTFTFPAIQSHSVAEKVHRDLQDIRAGNTEVPVPKFSMNYRAWLFGTEIEHVRPEPYDYSKETAAKRDLWFYRAKNIIAPAPCLVVIHGGSWESGDKSEFPQWASYWAKRGYAVASINYRLAPIYTWPAPKEDVAAAIAFLKTKAAEFKLDPTRFVLVGRSAGAQIATASACLLKDQSIRGCVAFYGPADMLFAWENGSADDIMNTPLLLGQYLNGSPQTALPRFLDSSAIYNVTSECPPTLLLHGARDVLVWNLQSRRLKAQLDQHHVPNVYLELPWATHAFDYIYDGPGSQLARYTIDAFLQKILAQ